MYKLTDDDVAQLKAFAKLEGKRWKHILAYEYWYRGLPVPGYPALYGLRNELGPSWFQAPQRLSAIVDLRAPAIARGPLGQQLDAGPTRANLFAARGANTP